MKKFFTNIPLQVRGQLARYQYQAVGNDRLRWDKATSFPILCAVNGYVKPGEDFRLIAVVSNTDDGRRNLAALESEVQELCAENGVRCPMGVETVPAPDNERVSSHMDTFQKLIDYTDDGDELFSCVTFGTKPMSMAILMAIRYAYRLKKNTSVSCVVYGQVDRSGSEPRPFVYDETALVQMDEILRLLAERGVDDPRRVLDSILSL